MCTLGSFFKFEIMIFFMVTLLSPVRDMTSLRAAVSSGADEVYFGIGELNMRVNSKGIPLEMLESAVEFAHKNNVKVCVVLNTLSNALHILSLRRSSTLPSHQ